MIIADYYGQSASFSYLMGHSNGGRDGMVASQKFPDLPDGIVSQNPGSTCRRPGSQRLERAGPRRACNKYRRQWTTLDSSNLPVVSRTGVASAAILCACDGLDGLVDGIIDDFHASTNERV